MGGNAVIGTGARLAEDRLIGIIGGAARGSEFDSSHHPRLHIRNVLFDIEVALQARNELRDVVLRLGMLQIVQIAAICDGGNKRGELEGRLLDSQAEDRHHAGTVGRWSIGNRTGLFFVNGAGFRWPAGQSAIRGFPEQARALAAGVVLPPPSLHRQREVIAEHYRMSEEIYGPTAAAK